MEAQKKKKRKPYRKKGGCLKSVVLIVLLLPITYLGLHIYFIWQPAGGLSEFNQQVINLSVANHRVFPAVKGFDPSKIDGRDAIIDPDSVEEIAPPESSIPTPAEGNSPTPAGDGAIAVPAPIVIDPTVDPKIKKRLETAINKRYPVTFREDEINIWLNNRIRLAQGGGLAQFAKAKYVWVDFKKDEIELIIEREIFGQHTHMTSLFVEIKAEKDGFSLNRNAAHIGQVKIPGGFARLIIPAFDKMAEELSEDIEIYKDKDGKTKLYDIKVEDGKITLDPRLPSQR